MSVGSPGHHSLPFGAFYGRVDVRHRTPGIEVAVLDADPHRVVERHTHDDAHFVLVLDGLYVSSAVGAAPVSSGPALIFNPAGTTHRDRFEARAHVVEGRFLTLSLAADLLETADRDVRAPERAIAIQDAHTIALAVRLVRECHAHSRDAALARESLALSLLSAVSGVTRSNASSPPEWLGIARELLDDCSSEDVRIGDVAQAAGVHPVHLARVFRRYFDCTPGDYLRQRRLDRARVLLRETRRSLSDIAFSCGFADQSHFAKAFRNDTALTPSAFRRLWSA